MLQLSQVDIETHSAKRQTLTLNDGQYCAERDGDRSWVWTRGRTIPADQIADLDLLSLLKEAKDGVTTVRLSLRAIAAAWGKRYLTDGTLKQLASEGLVEAACKGRRFLVCCPSGMGGLQMEMLDSDSRKRIVAINDSGRRI